MKTGLIICIVLGTACAEDPKMFAAGFDGGELEGLDTDTAELEGLDTDTAELEGLDTDTAELEGLDTDTAELEGLDTDTAELEGLDTDTAELEGLDTDTAELEGLDTDTAELEGLDTDTGPPWVCDFNGEGCENWQKCATETISICPLSQDPIPISAINYGIEWLICRPDNRCPTDLPHRDCREVVVIGTRCLP